MSRYISCPNLPENKITKIICGTEDKKILDFFKKNNIEVLPVNHNDYIDPAIALHADISALHLGGNKIIVDKTQTGLIKELCKYGMQVYTTQNEIAGEYPSDIALNFAISGSSVIGNFKYADENLSDKLTDKRRINVRQGYCKCSVLIINESAIITDDESIHKKVSECGIDSLLISKGDILLPGHSYGFIGGASFKLSRDTIVFCGDIKKHKDYTSIISFAEKYGCHVISTDDDVLRDIGGIVSLCED